MILIHIVAKTTNQAIEIVDTLTEDKLILNSIISKEIIIRKNNDGKMVSENRTLIIGKTKSILFNTIEAKLRTKYLEMPILYSIPITQMDWRQADFLSNPVSSIVG